MTTNLISIEFGTRRGQLVVSACPGFLPRLRPAYPMADGVVARVADWQKHKSTGVSVPGCRGVT
ncbi:hypothetical protein [Pseudonocardia endophytica]|jgi:hypothetical protein|uniref:Uncharacterized protein n=1 Tax=Pseudonocardia endophytica TaxID=401976 RepID=A0A4V2PIY4_PSEEN|nr:hypothetical protein [Pseudonocardia endophytica]TCK26426.1 hypothetical protein EV378_2263 [Pseudonocardia endophytica]